MIPSKVAIKALHRRYAQNDTVFELVFGHCQIVSEIALWCVRQKGLTVDTALLEAGCLLHDIGTYALFDASGHTNNEHNYKQHAIFGAALAIAEGFDQRIADIIRTHVLMGLSKEEITDNNFALPRNDYMPTCLEGRLLCYADRFHSKRPIFNAYEPFLTRLSQEFPNQAEKFERAGAEFGIPNIESLAKKYRQPIRN